MRGAEKQQIFMQNSRQTLQAYGVPIPYLKGTRLMMIQLPGFCLITAISTITQSTAIATMTHYDDYYHCSRYDRL